MTDTASGFAGITLAITGATNGIGRAAAIEAARGGARVLLLVRDPDRGEAVCTAITELTGDAARGRVIRCDLADFASVRRGAAEVRACCSGLDVLANNAGVITDRRTLTVDGNEATFQVNHLSHFLLTRELLPALERGSGRVITVSSDAHFAAWRGLRLNDPGFARGWRPFKAYAHSKLANIMFTYELSRRLTEQASTVRTYALHPGMAKTGFGTSGWGASGRLWETFAPKLTPEQAADTLVYLMSSADVAGQSGGYFYRRRPKRSSPASHDTIAQAGLWELSERLTTEGAGQ